MHMNVQAHVFEQVQEQVLPPPKTTAHVFGQVAAQVLPPPKTTAHVFEQVAAQVLPPPTATAHVFEQVMPKNPDPAAIASSAAFTAIGHDLPDWVESKYLRSRSKSSLAPDAPDGCEDDTVGETVEPSAASLKVMLMSNSHGTWLSASSRPPIKLDKTARGMVNLFRLES